MQLVRKLNTVSCNIPNTLNAYACKSNKMDYFS